MSKTCFYSGLIAVTAGLVLTTSASAQVDPNFYVFLAFGQSNMEGYANLSGDITTADKTSLPRFQVLGATTCSGLQRTKDQWSPGIAPLVRCGTGLCPVDYFARTLVDSLPTNVRIGIVPVAVAGTKIEGFDPTGYSSYFSSQADWMKSIVTEYGGNPYARLVAMAKIAQKTGVIKGILLHQGESNAGESVSVWGNKVKTIYESLLKDLGLTASQCPLLAGQVANAGGMNNTIDGLPTVITTAHVISSSGLATHPSDATKLHFSAASYRTFGTRYAQQMLKLLPKSTSIAPSPKAMDLNANAGYVVYNANGTYLAAFHANDEASMNIAWTGVRKNLPNGIYWIKNTSTGAAQRVLAGL
jgi:Carbohydrate esterase, sialic acid-specific acetylesterase